MTEAHTLTATTDPPTCVDTLTDPSELSCERCLEDLYAEEPLLAHRVTTLLVEEPHYPAAVIVVAKYPNAIPYEFGACRAHLAAEIDGHRAASATVTVHTHGQVAVDSTAVTA